MTAQLDLERSAREAGAAGRSYNDWASDDATYELVMKVDSESPRGADMKPIEAAFAEGRREHRAKSWRSVWTTAPADYDQFGTETAEGPFPWEGKQLRRVLVDPSYDAHQCARYGSGLRGSWDEDPRVTEARIRETLAAERFEVDLRAVRRAGGLLWIREAPDDFLCGDDDAADEEARKHGLGWDDVRAERRRREEEKVAAERAATWARCRASFADGATLIDVGTAGFRGTYGWVSGQAKQAWRSCSVKPHYSCEDDAELAVVVEEGARPYGGESAGSLEQVASYLASGRMRIAGPDEHVPPRVVVQRIGQPFDEILRVEVDGAVAWVGGPTFGDALVLDDAGKVVRKKKLVERAMHAWREKMFGGPK